MRTRMPVVWEGGTAKFFPVPIRGRACERGAGASSESPRSYLSAPSGVFRTVHRRERRGRAEVYEPDPGTRSLRAPTLHMCSPRDFRRRLDGELRRDRVSVGTSHASFLQFAADSRHTRHDLARFVSIRFARASFLRAARLSGTPDPVPKYISSGVWPRKAECDSLLLCSST